MASHTKYRPASIVRGALVWLPRRNFIKVKLRRGLPAEVFDHPVLIFGIPDPQHVDVFLVTSFHAGESLIGKFRNDPEFRSRQVPIHPAPRHPDTGVLLTLADGRPWPKASYVSLSLFTVPSAALREEQKGPWSLSPESLDALDKLVAGLPRLPTGMKEANAEHAEPNDVKKGNEEQELEAEEGWTTVPRKRKKGMSRCLQNN